jgi:hypothetical protein
MLQIVAAAARALPAEKEVTMQQAKTWHSLQPGVGVLEFSRSRTRVRRRRRKRSWGTPWAYLLLVFLSRGIVWNRPAFISLAILSRGGYGQPVGRLCLITCGH